MKKMNVIPLIMSVFLLFSCAEQEDVISDIKIEQTSSKSSQEKENTYLSAQQVFYAATIEKIELLENELAELSGKKESGVKEAINEIENTQKEISKYKAAADYFYGMRPPRGPKGPIGPMPPVPCQDEKSNCNPIITNLKGIIVGDNNLKVKTIEAKDSDGEVVAKGEMRKAEYGRVVIMEVKEFEGQANMHAELVIGNETKITLEIPVRGF